MKRLICACMIIALAGAYAFAGDVAEVTTRQGWTTVYEIKDSLNELATGGTLTNGLTVTGEVSADGKYVVVGGDATTGLMVQKGTFTNGSAAVTFTVAFGAAPAVVIGWTDYPAQFSAVTNAAISATSISTTNFVPLTEVTTSLGTNANYIAVGTRP